jgi:hypothetical protein
MDVWLPRDEDGTQHGGRGVKTAAVCCTRVGGGVDCKMVKDTNAQNKMGARKARLLDSVLTA